MHTNRIQRLAARPDDRERTDYAAALAFAVLTLLVLLPALLT